MSNAIKKKNSQKKSRYKPLLRDANGKKRECRFICKWSPEVHALIKMHASMGYETINQWVLKAILEKLGEVNKFVR